MHLRRIGDESATTPTHINVCCVALLEPLEQRLVHVQAVGLERSHKAAVAPHCGGEHKVLRGLVCTQPGRGTLNGVVCVRIHQHTNMVVCACMYVCTGVGASERAVAGGKPEHVWPGVACEDMLRLNSTSRQFSQQNHHSCPALHHSP